MKAGARVCQTGETVRATAARGDKSPASHPASCPDILRWLTLVREVCIGQVAGPGQHSCGTAPRTKAPAGICFCALALSSHARSRVSKPLPASEGVADLQSSPCARTRGVEADTMEWKRRRGAFARNAPAGGGEVGSVAGENRVVVVGL